MSKLTNEQLIEVSRKYDTPVYVYHAEKFTEQYQDLKTAFSNPNVVFFYACKSLTNINVLKHFLSIGCNIDCSSINEVKLALYAGFNPSNILYTSNGISFDEIVEAKNLDVNINIDSISNLKKFGQKFGHSYPVGIRIRPNILAGGNMQISTGHDNSKFGIPIEQFDAVLETVNEYNLFIETLHIHTGSDIEDINVFIQGIEIIQNIIPYFKDLQNIDLGSGFKVAYKENDKQTDIILLAKKVNAFFQNSQLKIWFEPGKFLTSEAGYFITKVNVINETPTTTFVGINTGFNHLVRPMFYGSYHSIKNVTNPDGALKTYTVVGNLCETDTFAEERYLNEVGEGDLLVFSNAGSYGFEMSSNFNSRFKPAEVLIKNNEAFLIRRRDIFEDLIRTQELIN